MNPISATTATPVVVVAAAVAVAPAVALAVEQMAAEDVAAVDRVTGVNQESDRATDDDVSHSADRDSDRRQDRGGRGSKGPERKDKQCVCGSRNHSADDCPHTDRIRQLLQEDKEAERAMTQFRRVNYDTDEERTMTITTSKLHLPRGSVLLDNQSTTHLFRDGGFLNDICKAARAVRVTGIGGSVLSRREGDLNHFGTVIYAPAQWSKKL